MSQTVVIKGRSLGGNAAQAIVRSNGALLTGPNDDLSATVTAEVDDTTVTVVKPTHKSDIIVTGAVFSTDRGVGTNGATLEFFYDDVEGSTDVTNTLIKVVDMAKNSVVPSTPVNLRIPAGNFGLFKTNDDDATISVFYHLEGVA